MATKPRSIEQRLYESYQSGRGLRLSANEVDRLMLLDDAIRTRITNTACTEAGAPEIGQDCIDSCHAAKTWRQFVELFRDH